MLKKLFLSSFLCLFVFSIFVVKSSASSNEQNYENYRFSEVEQILISHLQSLNKNIEIGSPEYVDFIVDQYFNDSDQVLVSRPDYDAINAYMDEFLYQLNLQEIQLKNPNDKVGFNLDKKIKDKTIKEVRKEIEAIESKKSLKHKLDKYNTVSPLAVSYSYNVNNAKGYAATWYNGRSPAYPVYTLDCTNFISQILFAGGMKMNTSSVENGWYAETSYSSPNWRLVEGLYDYFSSRAVGVQSSTSKQTIITNAKVGDVIQLKKSGASRFSHSMFVYEKANSTLYLSAHTSDYLKKDFKTISSEWTTFRVIKF